MAGWCVVWEGGAAACDPARWAETLRLAARAGERVQSCRAAGYALAAWARPRGEFRCSGRILEPAVGTRVAWLGQVRERDQDVSARAAATLADERTTHDQVAGLNGPFASAAVQRAGRGIALWTDRHRHYPIYMVRSGDRLVAATDLLCLRPWLVRRELDRQVLDLLLRTGECLDRTCLVTGVEILPPATCAGLRDGRYFEQRYWAFRFEAQRGLKPADCAMEAGRRLHAAVLNVEATGARLGVPLSGGLDSRFLLGLCRAPQKVPSFTWGAPGCRDIRYGRNVAAAFGSPHRIRTWAPEAFVPLWQEGVARTGGATGVDEMYLLPFVELLAGHCDAILDGLAGDALLGGNFLKWRWLRARSLSELAAASWRWRVSPAEDDCIDRLLPGCEPGAARRTWLASIMARGDGRPVERFNEWLFENRVFRHANCGTLLVRGGVEAHAPFFDRDVVDFLLRVPLGYKLKHRLYLRTLCSACPPAARPKWARTGIPPAWGFAAHLAALTVQRGARAGLRRIGLRPFADAAVADPAGWFRGAWRAPAADLLFSARALDRDLYDARTLRALWDAHQGGADLTRQLGVLVAVELLARLMLDGADRPAEAEPQAEVVVERA